MKRLISGLVLTCGALSLSAAEITAEQARRAVECWKSLSAAVVGDVAEVQAYHDAQSGVRFHVAKLSSRGFVITAADDEQEPIIGFSTDGEFQAKPGSPLLDILCRMCAAPSQTVSRAANTSSARKLSVVTGPSQAAMTSRAKWDLLLGGGRQDQNSLQPPKLKAVGSNSGANYPFHACVLPMLTTHWGQGSVGDRILCYNMYTPVKEIEPAVSASISSDGVADAFEDPDGVHAVCGCVATAGAQLMKYFAYPTATVPKRKYSCMAFGKSVTLETRGEKYRWSDMVDRPSASTPQSKREAIGALTYDVGVASRAEYDVGLTGAYHSALASALTDLFGYSQAINFGFGSSGTMVHSADNFKRVVVPNLICRKPLLLSMRGSNGHEIVVDGYGYDGSYGREDEELYVHMNFGWSGNCDLWFRPPLTSDPILASSSRYNYYDGIIGNIAKSGSGSIVAGRVQRWDATTRRNYGVYLVKVQLRGMTTGGVAVSEDATTDSDGQYHFVVQPGSYTLFAYEPGGHAQSANFAITVGKCTGSNIGNVLQDIQLDEAAVATAPVVDDDQLLKNVISVTCSMPEATIRYTDDGSEPTLASHLYVSPISVWKSCEYRFAAFAPGMARSPITSVSLTIAKWQTDSFESAGELSGDEGSVVLNNENASREAGEPSHAGITGGGTVWAKFTPETDGDYTFTLSGKSSNASLSIEPILAVYTGSSLADIDKVGSVYNYPECRLSIHARAGVTYRLAMDTYQDGVNWGRGDLTLSWRPGFAHKITLNNAGAFSGGGGESHSIALTSSDTWQVTDAPSWVSFDSRAGQANAPLTFRTLANTTGKLRTGTIVVSCGNAEPASLAVYQGTQTLYRRRQEAIDAATRGGKKILLVYGRETCSNTRSTMMSSCETSPVRETLRDGYVIWFCNCDHSETRPEGAGYFTGMPFTAYPEVAVISPAFPDSCHVRAGSYQSVSALTSLLDRAKKIPVAAATDSAFSDRVRISWSAVSGASQYVVYRGTSSTSLSAVASGVTSLSYDDTAAAEGAQYYYAVAAVIGSSTGERSIPVAGRRRLLAPQVTISPNAGASYKFAPVLTWNAVPGAQYYGIYRRYAGEAELTLLTVCMASTMSFTDTAYVAGRSASYAVVACYGSTWNSAGRFYELAGVGETSAVATHLKGASITYDYNDDERRSYNLFYEVGATLSYLSSPSREGYRFDGWFTASAGGQKVEAPYTLTTRTRTLYAHWTPYAYRVELVGPEAIYEQTAYYVVATVTNLANGVKCVTNETSWRVVSGTAAAFDEQGKLSPVASSGNVVIEGRTSFWDAPVALQKTVAVIRKSDILGLVVDGPAVYDQFDRASVHYDAYWQCSGNRRFQVVPKWTVDCPDVSSIKMSESGDLSFATTILVTTVTVAAVAGTYSNDVQTLVYGCSASLGDWALTCNSVWPGKEIVCVPGDVRWYRHGRTEAPTADMSDLYNRIYVHAGLVSISLDGVRYILPDDSWNGDEKANVTLYLYGARDKRYLYGRSKSLHFFSSRPTLMTVRFDAGAGKSLLASAEYAVGRPYLNLPPLTRPGYYGNWYTAPTSGTVVDDSSNCESSVSTLYAHWYPNSYYVSYDANGGTGQMYSQYTYYDTDLTLQACTFTKAGCSFLGWATEPDGKVVYKDKQTVRNLTTGSYQNVRLYAVWKAPTYVIRFVRRVGEGAAGVPLECWPGKVYKLPKNAFTNGGKRFAGWACSNGRRYDDGMLVFDLAKPGETVTMTAIWE